MNVSIWEMLLRKVKPRTFRIYFSFTILQLSLSTVILTEIAFGFCPFDASSGFAPMRPDYKESCREVAYGICRGVVGDKVEDNGCLNTPDNKIVQLQNKCVDQVNLMTGGPIFINSPEPTPR